MVRKLLDLYLDLVLAKLQYDQVVLDLCVAFVKQHHR